jgi:uncharacterized OB-fold protein
MKHPTPNPTGTSAPHWQAAREARLALPYCESCVRFHWPVRARCPECRGAVTWRNACGLGRIATFSIVRRAVNPELADDAPYAVAFVDLDEGVRIFANIVEVQADALRIGMRVCCRFECALDAAVQVPVFVPDSDLPSPPTPTQEAARIGGRTALSSPPGRGAGGEGRDCTTEFQGASRDISRVQSLPAGQGASNLIFRSS